MAAFCHLSSVRPSTWPLYCEIVMKRLLSKWPLKARISRQQYYSSWRSFFLRSWTWPSFIKIGWISFFVSGCARPVCCMLVEMRAWPKLHTRFLSLWFFYQTRKYKYERMGDQKTLSKTRAWNTYSMPILLVAILWA